MVKKKSNEESETISAPLTERQNHPAWRKVMDRARGENVAHGPARARQGARRGN